MATKVEELYKDDKYSGYKSPCFDAPGDYDRMVADFGEIILKTDEGYYQGDYLYILKRQVHKTTEFGFLVVGYGSCSGCDALQGCSSWEEVQELYDSMKNNVKWTTSKKKLLREIIPQDVRYVSWYEAKDQADFILKASAALTQQEKQDEEKD